MDIGRQRRTIFIEPIEEAPVELEPRPADPPQKEPDSEPQPIP